MGSINPQSITIRLPSKYSSSPAAPESSSFTHPPLEWLHRTWAVTHSTLSMWRSARNVRITYKPIPSSNGGPVQMDDLVEYESCSAPKPGDAKFPARGIVKAIGGVDTAAAANAGDGDTSSWNWRGRGWLLWLIGSHWEILGWGEREISGGEKERWVVTWFEATLFTKEGVDIYSDRREAGSPELVEEILGELKGLKGAEELVRICEDMKAVEISLPWAEK
ncbi:hypothetical protein QBC37DRAFT_286788 [Rhypophila decipiens]|uniref:Uncharacterized protein n=1 Tax=Rhypophila decipiens TaxID=261697 RepID=A0AAN6Y5H0_9PEZI|nr:hypothetical protein QBC37DRAFT_286788 [Rhypophila decipiens]